MATKQQLQKNIQNEKDAISDLKTKIFRLHGNPDAYYDLGGYKTDLYKINLELKDIKGKFDGIIKELKKFDEYDKEWQGDTRSNAKEKSQLPIEKLNDVITNLDKVINEIDSNYDSKIENAVDKLENQKDEHEKNQKKFQKDLDKKG